MTSWAVFFRGAGRLGWPFVVARCFITIWDIRVPGIDHQGFASLGPTHRVAPFVVSPYKGALVISNEWQCTLLSLREDLPGGKVATLRWVRGGYFVKGQSKMIDSEVAEYPPNFDAQRVSRDPLSESSGLQVPGTAMVTSGSLSTGRDRMRSSQTGRVLSRDPSFFAFSQPAFVVPSRVSIPVDSTNYDLQRTEVTGSPMPMTASVVHYK